MSILHHVASSIRGADDSVRDTNTSTTGDEVSMLGTMVSAKHHSGLSGDVEKMTGQSCLSSSRLTQTGQPGEHAFESPPIPLCVG